jgi:subtilisin family serine protease
MQNLFNLPPYTVDKANSDVMNWGMALEGIPDVWRITKGQNVKIAILDTGIAQRHQDLAGVVLQSIDFTGSKNGVEDQVGHGTFCAGIIGARQNKFGVVGVAPECQLLIAKVAADNKTCYDQAVINGLNWAVLQGADIISMSVGTPSSTNVLHGAVIAASQKAVIVCAAGNNGPALDSVNYPARYAETISVGAIDRNKHVPNYSSRGDRVDIVAPGDQIVSCWPPNNMAMLSGTSMACPFVAGIIGLMVAVRKKDSRSGMNRNEIVSLLSESTIDIGPPGKDNISGFGLINPMLLLRESVEHYPK